MTRFAELNSNDVPVLLIGYNRPDFLIKRIHELSGMGVKHLYVSVDGGLPDLKEEINSVILKAYEILNGLNTLEVNLQNANFGMVKHITNAISIVFKKFDYIIVVEDDIVLSKNFYYNMLKGLNLQINKNKTGIVGAFSPIDLSKFKNTRNLWRTTKYVPLWGWGCSFKVWQEYNYDLSLVNIEETLSNSKTWNSLNQHQKNVWLGRFIKSQKNPEFTWDMQFQYLSFIKNFTNIAPVSRFVSNEGFLDSRAVHTKGNKPKWFLNGDFSSIKIESDKISIFSKFIEKIIDSNTYAGDTKMFNRWAHLRQNKNLVI